MQREGLKDSEWPNIYFGSKHKLHKSVQRVPRPVPARRRGRGVSDGGRPRLTAVSVNRTEHGSSGSLWPSASVHYGRTDTF